MSTTIQGLEIVIPAAIKSLRGGYEPAILALASFAAVVPGFAHFFGSLSA
jgi:hypothetical protein